MGGDYLGGDRYRLMERIGKGGFADVWKAYDEVDCDWVAIKVLHGQHAQDRSRRERFFRGARQMKGLRHQAVVSVLEEEGEDDGFHYFVMEFVDGPDLARLIEREALPLEEIVRIVIGGRGGAGPCP